VVVDDDVRSGAVGPNDSTASRAADRLAQPGAVFVRQPNRNSTGWLQ
jgi:hypothetical protein